MIMNVFQINSTIKTFKFQINSTKNVQIQFSIQIIFNIYEKE